MKNKYPSNIQLTISYKKCSACGKTHNDLQIYPLIPGFKPCSIMAMAHGAKKPVMMLDADAYTICPETKLLVIIQHVDKRLNTVSLKEGL